MIKEIFLMLLLVSPVMAQTITADNYNKFVVSTCLNSTALQNTLSVYRCVNNDCSTINSSAIITCQYGCNSRDIPNQCNPSQQQANYTVGFVILILILAMLGAVWWLLRRR